MKYAKQTGGRGQYGHVKIHLYPGEPGTGYIFENESPQGSIPEGIHQARPTREASRSAHRGVLAGYPIDDDVRSSCYDGSYHDVDSSENGVQDCGRWRSRTRRRRRGRCCWSR